VTDDSYAFWRRVRLIPFTRQFKQDADPHLAAKLRVELPGILSWAVEGCIRWQVDGLRSPSSVLAATEAYQQDSDPLGAFLAERCIIADQCSVAAGRLCKEYAAWAEDQGMRGKEVLSATALGRRLSARFESRHTKNGRLYKGIGLGSDGFAPPEGDGFGGQGDGL
jgi:putative DNA primase/helicase